jgi:23S rRNA-/tRNA-specific pseudouridylate synthase
LSEAFGLGRVEKEYLALVRGEPPGEAGVIDAPVARAGGGRRLMRVASGGKASRTEWRVRERFAGYALLEVTPRTGRTHQIRVHLAHEGMPLAVDDMYGGAEALLLSDFKRGYRKKGREKPLLSRLSLHCARLRFEHPATGLPVSAAAAPGDFERALKALAKYAARPTAGQQ